MTKPKRNRGRHRVPPKPPSMLKCHQGFCKFCGGPVMKNGKLNRRATWHPECALKWTIMNSPRDARYFVFVRDRGICRSCGKNCQPENGDPEAVAKIVESILSPPEETKSLRYRTPVYTGHWELDHVFPLSEAIHVGEPMALWMLSNMSTLCHECHVKKTKLDRVIYAEQLLLPRRTILNTMDAIAALAQHGFVIRHHHPQPDPSKYG